VGLAVAARLAFWWRSAITIPGQFAVRSRQQAGEQTQQARFARSVRPDQGQRVAAGDIEADLAEDLPLAPDAGEIGRDELVRLGHTLLTRSAAAPSTGFS